VSASPLRLTRTKILAHRRRAAALDERLPPGKRSLRRAAWAGLQDSMPRAALLSIHARVERIRPTALEDPSLAQLWGPRYQLYVVAARDLPVFSLGRLPDDEKSLRLAMDLAERLHAHLGDRRVRYGEAGRALGIDPNRLRYAAATGTVLLRWEGARAPTIWSVPAPEVEPLEAQLELARRYLNVFGPTTPASFARWAAISRRAGVATFERLGVEIAAVRTAIGEGWILASDEPSFRAALDPPAPARLLPSGDAYFLLHGADRELLVPRAERRDALWTPRVWPGAVMLGGEIVGTWRRDRSTVTVEPWGRFSRAAREAVVEEAEGMPLPGIEGTIEVRWLA